MQWATTIKDQSSLIQFHHLKRTQLRRFRQDDMGYMKLIVDKEAKEKAPGDMDKIQLTVVNICENICENHWKKSYFTSSDPHHDISKQLVCM